MSINLTEGSEKRALILFSLPMIAGNMLQQLYNVTDTLIVGKFIGENALAAVGSAYALMVLLTSIILGLCMGSGVVFSQLYGGKKADDLKVSIFNAFVFTSIVTIVINLLAYLLLDSMMRWLNMPSSTIEMSKSYLSIIFSGIVFTFLYNFFAAVLRSVGNTTVPLIFLGVSALLNIVLDIIFVLPLGMGIEGAAIATVIAQGVSSVAIAIFAYKKAADVFPRREHMRYSKRLLKLVINNSVLTSIQQSIMNFGILMIQGLVNSFGVATMAAFAAVVKIDAFIYMPAQDFGNAYATFVAQNHGAGRKDRIKRGTKSAVCISAGFCLVASAFACIFARPLMLMFVDPSQQEIIAIGMQYLRIEGACYVGIGMLFLLYGFYRGIGKAGMSILLTVLSLGTRVVLAYLLAGIPAIGLVGIWWAIPIGWLLADLVGVAFLKRHIA